ncbi:SRPBCC domain-containing protein [Ornithinicoccus halotolerans]|uniref:SRPBCC domain-containing protein n=1 Tax=Ornithinicoccus halotolerans TaxID=1748220 RepID=UPI00129750C7|nr:SRPBCC domain-containing protein [Ornithinicoccus halotolerans]
MSSTPTTPTATGRHERREGRDWIVFTRTFRAPVQDVWAAVTEPERMARWIGTWHGDPTSGTVWFRMTAEEGMPEEEHRVEACEPPHRLRTRSVGEGPDGEEHPWVLELRLSEQGGVTTLEFCQDLPDPAMAHHVGPGWDYYLDRLEAAFGGRDADEVEFEPAYYPGLMATYQERFPG